MLLAIDSGNTNVVFAVFDGDVLKGVWRTATDGRRTADEYAVWLMQLMALEHLGRGDITDAVIASVVPQSTFNLKLLCRRYFGCEPVVVGDDGADLGIKVLLDRPEEIGADRLVNAVAVLVKKVVPAIVVDFGTATTFDVIDSKGTYCGGAIAPGINLSMEALHLAAAKLPRIDIRRPRQVVGKSTIEAMQSGIFWGYVGLIEGLIRRIQDERNEKMTVIATGGLASLFRDATPAITAIDPDLTLRGLVEIHRRTRALAPPRR